MIVKITSKRQITFPARVLDALGVGPGDKLELEESPDGFILRPKRIDLSKLGTLGDKIPPGHPPFNIRKFRDQREQGYGPSLDRKMTTCSPTLNLSALKFETA